MTPFPLFISEAEPIPGSRTELGQDLASSLPVTLNSSLLRPLPISVLCTWSLTCAGAQLMCVSWD